MKWIKEVFKNIIIQFASSFLVSIAAGFGITAWIKGSKLYKFLIQPFSIPGWVIIIASSVFFGFILFLFLLFLLNRKNRVGIRNYPSYGLFWDLTPNFFEASDKIPASKAHPTHVREWIHGPFCPICNTDVTDKLTDASFKCINEHDLKEIEAYRILEEERRKQFASFAFKNEWWDKIRKKVYEEAQGKARNGLL